jgi:hypothetical protein
MSPRDQYPYAFSSESVHTRNKKGELGVGQLHVSIAKRRLSRASVPAFGSVERRTNESSVHEYSRFKQSCLDGCTSIGSTVHVHSLHTKLIDSDTHALKINISIVAVARFTFYFSSSLSSPSSWM